MKNLSFLHLLSLALPSYMHFTKVSHNSSLRTPPILSTYTQHIQLLLQQNIPLLQIIYKILSEYVFPSECLEQSLANFVNTLIQVSKSLTIRSLTITTFHFLKSGSPFSYMIVLNVKAINTLI